MTAEPTIRDAATLILVRNQDEGPAVLMGQRGAGAVFMPNKYVFPGGAVDSDDHGVLADRDLDPDTALRLARHAAQGIGPALVHAALRELREETGLTLSTEGPAVAARYLSFVFRAVTPPGRPRRFDARFFLADARNIAGNPDDFAAADDELSHLHWVPLTQARDLDLPFITGIVLSELEARLAASQDATRPVPFFDHEQHYSRCRAI